MVTLTSQPLEHEESLDTHISGLNHTVSGLNIHGPSGSVDDMFMLTHIVQDVMVDHPPAWPWPGAGFPLAASFTGAHIKVCCKCIDTTFISFANSPSGHRMMDFPFRFSVFSGTSPMFLTWGRSHFLQGGVWIAC